MSNGPASEQASSESQVQPAVERPKRSIWVSRILKLLPIPILPVALGAIATAFVLYDRITLVETVSIARRCHRTIMQNFIGTVVVDSIGVGLAAFGFLNLLMAAFIHVSSEMAFILNSARLLPPISSTKKPG